MFVLLDRKKKRSAAIQAVCLLMYTAKHQSNNIIIVSKIGGVLFFNDFADDLVESFCHAWAVSRLDRTKAELYGLFMGMGKDSCKCVRLQNRKRDEGLTGPEKLVECLSFLLRARTE